MGGLEEWVAGQEFKRLHKWFQEPEVFFQEFAIHFARGALFCQTTATYLFAWTASQVPQRIF